MAHLSQHLAHKCVSIQVGLLISGQVIGIADMWCDCGIEVYTINFQEKKI